MISYFSLFSGVVDSSGMRFYYTTDEPEHESGGLSIGHNVDPTMLIPPRAANYTVTAICPMDCTSVSFVTRNVASLETRNKLEFLTMPPRPGMSYNH